jgi:hypothetical protein
LRSRDDGDDIQELHWSIQNASKLAIHALAQGGYDAQWLKARLNKSDAAKRPITQPNTRARQESLAHARGHGGRFHATGGMHITSDDLFISIEMNARNDERATVEKEKKLRLSLQANEDKAMGVINQGKPLNLLSVADLDVLLAYHQAPKTKGAKKVDKVLQWMTILADDSQPPAYERWTDDNEERLRALAATDIDISDTQYGREIALKKRELEAAVDKFSWEERDAMRQKWDAMDAEEIEEELAMDAEEAIASLEGELQAEVTKSTEGESGAD